MTSTGDMRLLHTLRGFTLRISPLIVGTLLAGATHAIVPTFETEAVWQRDRALHE